MPTLSLRSFARMLARAPQPRPRRAVPAPPPTPDARIPDLDGLRGLAIFLVICVHSTAAMIALLQTGFPVSAADRFAYLALHVGWCGVDLFFVLSGFLITGILLKAKGQPRYYRNFYVRRALRILPLYYAVLLTRIVLSYVGTPLMAVNPGELTAHALYVGNFWQCHARLTGLPFDKFGLHVLWSLAIEEQFYLVWPLVVALASRRWLWRLCFVGVVAALACRWGMAGSKVDYWLVYVLPFCRMDGLLIGAMVALMATGAYSRAAFRRAAWGAVLGGAAGVAALLVLDGSPVYHGKFMLIFGFTAFAVLFAGVLDLVLLGQPGGWRVLRGRVLRFVGERSYAVYLLHFPVVIGVFQLFMTQTVRDVLRPACEAVGCSLPLYACYLGAVLGGSLLLAQLTWVLIERPFLRLKRHFPSTMADVPGTKPPPAETT
jgi:peptidoglycan/LPS O-acetylase OafA/YrhL